MYFVLLLFLYSLNKNIKALVGLNGSCGWQNLNEILKKTLGITMTGDMKEIENKICTFLRNKSKNVDIYLRLGEINGLTGFFIDDMLILMKILNNKEIATIIIKVK